MVTLGGEILLDRRIDLITDRRIGLITNPSGINSNAVPTIDLLFEHTEVDLDTLFAPEHGIRGRGQAGVDIQDGVDERTELPVKSLYGEDRRLRRHMIDDLDVIIYDMQDIGCRFYTLIYTLADALQGVADTTRRLIVLDRPNPIAPLGLSGNLVRGEFSSFVGGYGLPITHGMTVGELARYFNEAFDIGADLEVVELAGWSHDEWYDETDLPWVLPSPNMPTLDTATLYPGACLFEGTTLSEGRGTTKPFELIGAPWIDAEVWADSLNATDLPGVAFRPAYFVPMFSKHERDHSEGVQVHVLDRDRIDPVKIGLTMLMSAFNHAPQADWIEANGEFFIDQLAGGSVLRETIDDATDDEEPGDIVNDILDLWEADRGSFVERRNEHRLYD